MASLPRPQMGRRKLHLPAWRLLAAGARCFGVHSANPRPVDRQRLLGLSRMESNEFNVGYSV